MQVTRRLILQKARHQATDRSRQHPLTACRHVVSGTISLPFRGAFHLSLTVLVHYRSPRVFSLGRWSAPVPPREAFHGVLRWSITEVGRFRLRGCHPLWPAFPDRFD